MSELVRNIIDAIETGSATETEFSINQVMAEKISARLDDMRVQVAQNMFATEAVEVNEETELTLEDYSLEEIEEFMMSEDFEQLDEISGKVLGSYIQKARADSRAKYAHSKELDSDPKVKKISDKISDLYGRKEYTKSGRSKHSDAISKARNDIEVAKKKIDPNYPKSVDANKRFRGITKAIDKLSHGKLTNEQVEEGTKVHAE